MSFAEDMTSPPSRFSVVNLSTNEEVIAQLNPTEFEDEVGADYDKLSTPGQSHERMHFRNTQNYVVTMDLYFRAYTEAEYAEMNRARHMLQSWCYPRGSISSVLNLAGGPPSLLATWPEIFSIECKLLRCRFRNRKFRPTGGVVQWIASVQFEEDRSKRLTSEQVALVNVVRGEL